LQLQAELTSTHTCLNRGKQRGPINISLDTRRLPILRRSDQKFTPTRSRLRE
jgi:hypothetical protein